MAVSASISETFCINIDTADAAAAQDTQTVDVGRACQILFVQFTMADGAGGSTWQFQSRADGTGAWQDMMGVGADAVMSNKINNAAALTQNLANGSIPMIFVPIDGNILTSPAGQLRIIAGGANSSYVARYICVAQTPAPLTIVTT